MPELLAYCEPAQGFERAFWIVVPLLALCLYAAALVWLWRKTPELRKPLVAVYVLNLITGTVIILTPGGLNDGDDYGVRFLAAVLMAIATGFGAAVVTSASGRAIHLVVAGLLGAVTFIGGMLGLFVFWLVAANTCLF
jgi:hypothetical protein